MRQPRQQRDQRNNQKTPHALKGVFCVMDKPSRAEPSAEWINRTNMIRARRARMVRENRTNMTLTGLTFRVLLLIIPHFSQKMKFSLKIIKSFYPPILCIFIIYTY